VLPLSTVFHHGQPDAGPIYFDLIRPMREPEIPERPRVRSRSDACAMDLPSLARTAERNKLVRGLFGNNLGTIAAQYRVRREVRPTREQNESTRVARRMTLSLAIFALAAFFQIAGSFAFW
jgi:hypothetical protein